MQRQLMSELIAWKSRANRKPLLLKGARQTGKTWLLNEFASQQYRNVIRFDFMLEPSARSLFDGDLDPKRIISQIELLRGQTVTPTDTLIIFDEIQEAPRDHLAQVLQRACTRIPHRSSRFLYGPRAPTRKRVISRRQNRPAHHASHGVCRVRSRRRRQPARRRHPCRRHEPSSKRHRKARALAQGIPCCRWYARSCLRFRRDTRLH